MASLWQVTAEEEEPNHGYPGSVDGAPAGRGGEPAIAGLSGSLALWLALSLPAYGIAAGLLGARRGPPGWMPSARGAVWGQFAALSIAVAALEWALLRSDLSIRYVAQNSIQATP